MGNGFCDILTTLTRHSQPIVPLHLTFVDPHHGAVREVTGVGEHPNVRHLVRIELLHRGRLSALTARCTLLAVAGWNRLTIQTVQEEKAL